MSELLPAESALEQIRTTFRKPGFEHGELEQVELDSASGRVLAQDVLADRDLPPFHRSMVDGYGIRQEAFLEGARDFHVIGTLLAGEQKDLSVEGTQAVKIMTGAAVPAGTTAVLKRESVLVEGDRIHLDRSGLERWFNVARRGEDAQKGEKLIPPGRIVDASVIAVASSVGLTHLDVYKRPTVSLITTGDEIVSVGEEPGAHQIRNANLHSLRQMMRDQGIRPDMAVHVKDDPRLLRESMEKGLQSDILILTGGVSMGDTDYVPSLLSELGVEKIFHRLKIKPGRPLWFGRGRQGNVVFGLPGNPVSCMVGFRIFITPWIRAFQGLGEESPLHLPLAREKRKKHDLLEYSISRIEPSEGVSRVLPLDHHGSGDFVSLLDSSGIMIHAAEREILPKGEMVAFYPWRPL